MNLSTGKVGSGQVRGGLVLSMIYDDNKDADNDNDGDGILNEIDLGRSTRFHAECGPKGKREDLLTSAWSAAIVSREMPNTNVV